MVQLEPSVVCLLRWFFCLLGHGSFHFFFLLPLFWVLLFIYDWQGFIILDVLFVHAKECSVAGNYFNISLLGKRLYGCGRMEKYGLVS